MNNKLLTTTNLYSEAAKRRKEISLIKQRKEENLRTAPEGKIHVIKKKTKVQYYLRRNKQDKGGVYISKTEERKIRTYLQKAYDEKILKLLTKEIAALDRFLKSTEDIVYQIRQVYSANPSEMKKIVTPIDISDEDYTKEWLETPYTGKPIGDNASIQVTDRGERVRSKSELNIANALYKHHIPYKYECPLTLQGGVIIYPDFTILDVRKRRVLYWEHRGMMDDRDYVKHSVMRIKDYQKNGIYIGDNLIITEEATLIPLGTGEIKDIIRNVILGNE